MAVTRLPAIRCGLNQYGSGAILGISQTIQGYPGGIWGYPGLSWPNRAYRSLSGGYLGARRSRAIRGNPSNPKLCGAHLVIYCSVRTSGVVGVQAPSHPRKGEWAPSHPEPPIVLLCTVLSKWAPNHPRKEQWQCDAAAGPALWMLGGCVVGVLQVPWRMIFYADT